MKIYHASENSYDFPIYEELTKNRKNHANGVLGLWFSFKKDWISGFGHNIYNIELEDNEITILNVEDLFLWEKTANKLISSDNNVDNEKLLENYYLNLRQELLKKYKAVAFKELNGIVGMGIILDFSVIKTFSLQSKLKDKIKF